MSAKKINDQQYCKKNIANLIAESAILLVIQQQYCHTKSYIRKTLILSTNVDKSIDTKNKNKLWLGFFLRGNAEKVQRKLRGSAEEELGKCQGSA